MSRGLGDVYKRQDLEREKKQKQAEDYERAFPLPLTNSLGEIKVTVKRGNS